jgi:hypothetical protein
MNEETKKPDGAAMAMLWRAIPMQLYDVPAARALIQAAFMLLKVNVKTQHNSQAGD